MFTFSVKPKCELCLGISCQNRTFFTENKVNTENILRSKNQKLWLFQQFCTVFFLMPEFARFRHTSYFLAIINVVFFFTDVCMF